MFLWKNTANLTIHPKIQIRTKIPLHLETNSTRTACQKDKEKENSYWHSHSSAGMDIDGLQKSQKQRQICLPDKIVTKMSNGILFTKEGQEKIPFGIIVVEKCFRLLRVQNALSAGDRHFDVQFKVDVWFDLLHGPCTLHVHSRTGNLAHSVVTESGMSQKASC